MKFRHKTFFIIYNGKNNVSDEIDYQVNRWLEKNDHLIKAKPEITLTHLECNNRHEILVSLCYELKDDKEKVLLEEVL